jgi:uncharacterized membrane protein
MGSKIIAYLGFLGFLSVLGLITGNKVFFGFVGFFCFFGAFGGKGNDERIERNIDRACRNAFLFMTSTLAFSITYIVTFNTIDLYSLAFTILFVGSMALFVFSYVYYDHEGD